MKKIVYRATLCVAALAIFYTAGFFLKNGEPEKLQWWVFGLIFFAWACLPFAYVVQFARKSKDSLSGLFISLLTVTIIAGGGFYILWQSFVTHLDPQSGLVFVFLPVYQLFVVSIGTGAARIMKSFYANKPDA